jgi:hypothetical protein
MKSFSFYSLLIFLFSIAIILARPCIIFASAPVRTAIEKEARVFGLIKTVRKRKEHIYTYEEYAVPEEPQKRLKRFSLPDYTSSLQKWLANLRLWHTSFLSYSFGLFKRPQTTFEVSPHNDQYLVLSVFKI